MSTSSPTLEERIRRIEDKQALHDLAHLYGFVMDERDLEGLSSLFTEDARLGSEDGVFDAQGLETIARTYQGRYDALGATHHFVSTVDDIKLSSHQLYALGDNYAHSYDSRYIGPVDTERIIGKVVAIEHKTKSK